MEIYELSARELKITVIKNSGDKCINKIRLNKDTGNSKKNQTEILELKNIIIDLKNSLEIRLSKLDQAGKKIVNLETNFLKLSNHRNNKGKE